jgi:nitroreductase
MTHIQDEENGNMDFFEVVKSRGSYRGAFKDIEIPEEDIRKIIEAGICAPSAGNFQETFFIAVKDAKVRAAIADIIPSKGTKTAPLIIVVAEQHVEPMLGLTFDIEDYAAATENILLAITALGYAGLWADGMTRANGNAEKIKALLDIDPSLMVKTIIPVGVPEGEVKPAPKKSFKERAAILK